MPTVSIVVAAYNVENTIRQALDSLLDQTMKDIEIICVDDGSTDGTIDILQQYAQRDTRVHVILHTSNRGLASVRYDGIMACSGRYVLFLDGDDSYLPNACEYLAREMERKGLDVLHYGAVLIKDPNSPPDQPTMDCLTNYLSHWPDRPPRSREDLLNACFEQELIQWNLWNKMYSLPLLKTAYAQYGGEYIFMAEDMLFTFMILYYAQHYDYTKLPFYCYRVGGGISTVSLASSKRRREAIAQEYQVYTLLCKWLPHNKSREYRAALQFVRTEICNAIFSCFFNSVPLEDCDAYLRIVLQYYPLDEFVTDLADAVFKKHLATPEQAALRLRDCAALAPRPRTVKTVASFYHRLYNGGVERVMALLAPIWQSAGYRVVIVTECGPTEQDYALPAETLHVAIPRTEGNYSGRVRAWQKLIQAYSIDAVVYHAWVGPDRFLDALAIKAQGVPFIQYTHSMACFDFKRPDYTGYLQEATDALSDVTVTLSEVDQAWWSALGFRSIQTVNPVTYSVAETAPSPLNSHNVVWVGRLSAEKQYYDAFEIARLVHDVLPDFRLHVVGQTEDPAQLRTIISYLADRDMTSYVLLDGFHQDVAPYYQSASVALCTSEYEGFSLTILESLLFGLPLVSYELPNQSTLRKGKGTFIVPQRNCDAAAQRIIQLLQDDELRHAMGRQARQNAEEFAQFDLAAHWKEIFETAQQPRPPRIPLYQQPPLQTAVRMAMRMTAQGAAQRAQRGYAAQPSAQAPQATQLIALNQQLAQKNAEYAVTLREIYRSTTYRVGRLLTLPFRWLKQQLRVLMRG